MSRADAPPLRSIIKYSAVGVSLCVLLVAGAGGFAAIAEISGAVVANGLLVVESSVKKVQHPAGGVVGALLVHEGSVVKAGDIVLKLDDTVARANLAIIQSNLNEALIREARLIAERDGLKTFDMPARLVSRAADPAIQQKLAAELRLLDMRINARDGQKDQFRQRIQQLEDEIKGQQAQAAAKKQEIDLIRREVEGVRTLWEKSLVPIQRVNAVERDLARLLGEQGALTASDAQTRGKITETELQILQVDQDMRSDVSKELQETQAKISELTEREVTALDQLKRIDLRASQDGIVHSLTIHTIGGVVNPAETIMEIVPDNDALAADIKVPPQFIDQVQIGQIALLRLSSLNQRVTPELNGQVTRIAADLETEQRTGKTYYTIRVTLPPSELDRLDHTKLVSGMPVEGFVKTGDRTILSYLMKPVSDQMHRALRER